MSISSGPANLKPAKPFLKWAGGKTQLLPVFRDYYPAALREGRVARYIEPFLGGGAVFFEVMQNHAIGEAHLFDINEELYLCYAVVQRDPTGLAQQLEEHRRHYAESAEVARADYYYTVRTRFNEQKASISFTTYADCWVARAADLIFLNKTCYNGLFRVNSAGHFNVPAGAYKNPDLFSVENLRQASAVLARATLHQGPYHACRPFVTDDSFVYFDPPYRPLSASARFTSYAVSGFDDADQRALARLYADLHASTGAHLMLSNSDPTAMTLDDRFFDEAYVGFAIHRIEASRMINSVGHKRGKVSELLILNYEVAGVDTNNGETRAKSTDSEIRPG